MASDRELIDCLAKGLEIEARPFQALAERFNMSEEEVVDRLQGMIEEGKVKRFAASVRHQPMGFAHNAMILARTDEENLDRVGRAASGYDEVSHCYQRSHPDGDPWCVYVMVHDRDKGRLDQVIKEIGSLPGVKGVEVCTSLEELKKTSLAGVTTDLSRLKGTSPCARRSP